MRDRVSGAPQQSITENRQAGRARESNPQSFDYSTLEEMLLDDLVDVFAVDVAIPNRFRIHHHDGAFFATVKAAALIDPHHAAAVATSRFHAPFCIIPAAGGIVVGATTFAVIALVDAKKYMALVMWFAH